MVIGENVLKLYIYPYCIQLVGYLGHNFDTGLGTKSKNCQIQENWLVYCQPVLVTALSLFVCLTAVLSIKMANCYSCLSWRQEYELSQMKTKVCWFFFPSQALGTAINSTKVMTAQQVVKTEDGGEVRTAERYVRKKKTVRSVSFTLNCCT